MAKTKPSKIKNLSTTQYSLKKLARMISMTPERVYNTFVQGGYLHEYPDKELLIKDLKGLKAIATLPAYTPVYSTYYFIEQIINQTNTYLMQACVNVFGPQLITYSPAHSVVPRQLYLNPTPGTETQIRATLEGLQNQLIGVLRTLVTTEQDFVKMVAYLEEGDFFGKVILFTSEASSQEYIVFQRKFEECICELASEVMIALPGGLFSAPEVLNRSPQIMHIIYQLLEQFSIAYVELIKAQCV